MSINKSNSRRTGIARAKWACLTVLNRACPQTTTSLRVRACVCVCTLGDSVVHCQTLAEPIQITNQIAIQLKLLNRLLLATTL